MKSKKLYRRTKNIYSPNCIIVEMWNPYSVTKSRRLSLRIHQRKRRSPHEEHHSKSSNRALSRIPPKHLLSQFLWMLSFFGDFLGALHNELIAQKRSAFLPL